MKKWFYRIKQDPKGSVSLFFILITAVVFAFNAVLIDYARILAVEQQTEYALQSAVRSSLAGYSNDLRKYGLFGIEESEADEIFQKVIKENLEVDHDEKYFNFIQPKIEGTPKLKAERALAGQDMSVLEHQILEEMKYKAPIEIVTNLIDGFSFLSKAMQKASEYTEIAEAIQKDFEKREENLDDAEKLLGKDEKNIQTKLKTFKNKMKKKKIKYPEVEAFSDIIKHYKTYEKTDNRVDKLKVKNDILEGELDLFVGIIAGLKFKVPWLKLEIANLEEEIEDLIEELEEQGIDLEDDEHPDVIDLNDEKTKLKNLKTNLRNSEEDLKKNEKRAEANKKKLKENKKDIEEEKKNKKLFIENAKKKLSSQRKLMTEIIDDLKTVQDKLETAKKHDDKMQKTVDDAEKESEDYYSDANKHGADVPSEASADIEKAIKDMEDSLEEIKKYPYQKNKKDFFKDVTTPVEEALASLETIPTSLKEIEDGFDESSKKKLQDTSKSILSSVDQAEKKVKASYKVIDKQRERYKRNIAKEEKHKTEAKDNTKKIKDNLGDWTGLGNDQAAYDQLKAILDKYLEHDNDAIEGMDIDTDASANASGAMGLMNMLFKELGGALAGARNKLYVNEYILMHFESAKPTGLTHSDDYKLENREVEYIIYGQHLPGANYGAALTQLFATRFAINFIDAFGNENVMAINEPLSKFLALLSVALGYTIDDMTTISEGGKSRIMRHLVKSTRFSMDYHGYLRLFLFMNPSTDARFQRIAALIEKDTGKDLTKHMTYVKGEVTTSKRLLFVPQIADALSYTGALNGVVDGNRFEFKKEAYFSY